MTTAYTSLLGLALPVTGELSGTWGDTVNNSITSLLDSAVAGTTNVSTDGDVTLTTTTGAANTAREAILLFSGARTALRTVTAPAQSKIYTVINATTGGYAVKLVGSGPTTGLTIPNGASAVVAWNGSDFVEVGAGSIGNLIVNGTLTVTGATTLQSTLAVTGNITNTAGTANGVTYLNGSKVLTSGTALTFSGSAFAVNSTAPGVGINDTTATVGVSFSWLNGGAVFSYGQIGLRDTTNSQNAYSYVAGASGYHNWYQNGTEQMRLTSTGLGIGISSPAFKLQVVSSTNAATTVGITNADTSTANYATQAYFRLDVAGNHIGGLKSTAKNLGGLSTSALYLTTAGAYPIAFGVNDSATPSMVLDTTGTLFVNTTARPSGIGGGDNGKLWVKQTTTGNYGISSIASATDSFISIANNGSVGLIGTSYGSTGSYMPLAFYTNDTERARIDTSGNLGIGTTSPAAKLDVFSNTGTSAPSARFYVNASGNTPSSLQGFSIFNNVSGGFVDTTLVAGNTANTYMAFGIHNGTSYSERMRIDSSGNVSIGTSTALATLTVNGSSGISYQRSTADAFGGVLDYLKSRGTSVSPAGVSNGDGLFQLRVAPYQGSAYTYLNAHVVEVDGGYTAGQNPPTRQIFYTNAANGSATNRLQILSTGTVGVGTTSVPALLNVGGNISSTYNSAGATGSFNKIGFTNVYSNASAIHSAIQATNDGVNTTGLAFLTSSTGNDGAERMRITSAGLVGVGTTTPVAKLDSRGTVYVATAFNGDNVLAFGGNPASGSTYTGAPSGANGNAFIVGESSNASGNPGFLKFYTTFSGVTLERMRIAAAGNVGIGDTAPTAWLDVYSGTQSTQLRVRGTSIKSMASTLSAHEDDVNGGRATWGSNAYTATSYANTLTRYDTTFSGWGITGTNFNSTYTANDALVFQYVTTGGTTSEFARIDSSGNLLVGTTTSVSGTNHIVVGSNSIQGIKKDFTNLGTTAQSFGFQASSAGVYVCSMKSISGASIAFLIACTFDNSAINMFTTSLGGCTAGGNSGTISGINGDARTYTFSRNGGTGLFEVTASSTATGTTTFYMTPLNVFA